MKQLLRTKVSEVIHSFRKQTLIYLTQILDSSYAVRQHKFIDTTNNEQVYYLIDYTDESEYIVKVLEVIETVRDVQH